MAALRDELGLLVVLVVDVGEVPARAGQVHRWRGYGLGWRRCRGCRGRGCGGWGVGAGGVQADAVVGGVGGHGDAPSGFEVAGASGELGVEVDESGVGVGVSEEARRDGGQPVAVGDGVGRRCGVRRRGAGGGRFDGDGWMGAEDVGAGLVGYVALLGGRVGVCCGEGGAGDDRSGADHAGGEGLDGPDGQPAGVEPCAGA